MKGKINKKSTKRKSLLENKTKSTTPKTNKKVVPTSKLDIGKNKDILNVMNSINKKFGKNSLRLGAEILKKEPLQRIPTGNVSLDIDLGGGIPVGRYTEISGAFSSTKTTQCLHIMRNAINMGLVVSFHDAEGTSGDEEGQPDKYYFNSLGIDTNSFIYNRPSSLEEVTEMILELQKSGEVNLAIWDSIAMTEPNKVLDSAMADNVQMGIKPKLLNEFFNKYQLNNNKLVREGKKPFTLICVNQIREKIGVMYGSPEYTPGGRGKGFTSSVDLRLRQGDLIKEKDNVVGQVVKYKILKNKTYMRLKDGEFDIYLDENSQGIPTFHTDNIKSIIIQAVTWGIINKGGSWFYLDENTKFQGLDKLTAYIKEHEEIIEDLKVKVLNMASKIK